MIGSQPTDSAPRSTWGIVHWISVTWLVVVAVAAVLADVLPLFDPADTKAGIPLSRPSSQNWLGTDALGRDLLSRTIHGARVSIVVGIAAVVLSSLVGGLVGLLAGYYKRHFESSSLFAADVLMAFPTMLLAASIVAFTNSRSIVVVVLAIALIYLGPTIRIVRALTLTTANREFVLAAQSVGARHGRVVRREIFPNVFPTLLAMMVVAVAGAIVAEGGLAYLGLSVAPPQPTWGAMIAAGKPKVDESLYPIIVPGGALFLTVLALTLIGDAIQAGRARDIGAIG